MNGPWRTVGSRRLMLQPSEEARYLAGQLKGPMIRPRLRGRLLLHPPLLLLRQGDHRHQWMVMPPGPALVTSTVTGTVHLRHLGHRQLIRPRLPSQRWTGGGTNRSQDIATRTSTDIRQAKEILRNIKLRLKIFLITLLLNKKILDLTHMNCMSHLT